MGASARPRGGGAAAKDLEKEDHDVLRDEGRSSVSVPLDARTSPRTQAQNAGSE